MSYVRIVHAVFNSPWAINRAWFGTIFSMLQSRVHGDMPPAMPPGAQLGSTMADIALSSGFDAARGGKGGGRFGVQRYGKDARGALVNHSEKIHAQAMRKCETPGEYYQFVREEEGALASGQILHIFGSGVLGKHLSAMDEMCAGGLSVDRIQAALREAKDDDKVTAILLHLDTPGGICYGMSETAALVRQIREKKTIAVFCDSLNASAGYWCSCQADNIYITPSADMGSIGVYSAVVDYTEWCAKQGIKVDLIKDGTHKGAGFPGTALTPEQRSKIEEDVLATSRAFKNDVKKGRAGISDETMQGQCFTGQAAIDARLADDLVLSLEEALADLSRII